MGEHLLPHKYFKKSPTCRAATTERLLNAGRGPQTSRKANQFHRSSVGKRETNDCGVGNCTLGKGDTRGGAVHTQETPSQTGSGKPQSGAQWDMCSEGKTENSPRRLCWTVLPNREAAQVLTSACSQRGAGCGGVGLRDGASGRGLGLTASQIPWGGWHSTAEADQEKCGSARKNKGSFLQEDSALWVQELRTRERTQVKAKRQLASCGLQGQRQKTGDVYDPRACNHLPAILPPSSREPG